jgi:hypothetical protein
MVISGIYFNFRVKVTHLISSTNDMQRANFVAYAAATDLLTRDAIWRAQPFKLSGRIRHLLQGATLKQGCQYYSHLCLPLLSLNTAHFCAS